jgi:membrane associated rhomboid family serine protease
MGFYDREYARDQRAFAWELSQLGLSKTLVIVHAGVYLVQLVTAGRVRFGAVTEFLMLDIADLHQGQVWRLLTAMFIHDPHNWLNLVWNLVLLWFFGPLVESLYGQRRFLFFYLLAGLVGNLAWWLVNLWHPHPPALFGAAPAITAVLVLCTFHYPRQTVLLFFVLPVPLWLITLLYVGKDVVGFLQQLGGLGRPGLAAVHVAGALFAVVYYQWSQQGWRLVERFRPARTGSISSTQATSSPAVDERLEAQVDAILDKLSRQGKDALTPREWEILHRASEAYRQRR